jgi:hypothetical protein
LQQIPAAFQDVLSMEKTPTLCHTVPTFECFIRKWEALRDDPNTPHGFYNVIKAGLEKLEDYQERTDDVPAYVIAMGTPILSYQILLLIFSSS